MGFWSDVQSAMSAGIAGSSNPYLSAAGGLLGGGGGSGQVIVAVPPPPAPPPPAPAGSSNIGFLAPGSMGLGIIVVGGLLFWALTMRK